MTENKIERLGRVKHPVLGDCVKVKLRHWVGPVYAGDKGKEVWTDYLFPRDQFNHAMHPRHASGFDPNGKNVTGCFSPSLSYFSELCKYANFRWTRPNDNNSS
jgi:hypothetical protein